MSDPVHDYLASIGRAGGKAKTEKKIEASRRNLENARKNQTAEQRREAQMRIDPEARRVRAQKAAQARWAKKNQ